MSDTRVDEKRDDRLQQDRRSDQKHYDDKFGQNKTAGANPTAKASATAPQEDAWNQFPWMHDGVMQGNTPATQGSLPPPPEMSGDLQAWLNSLISQGYTPEQIAGLLQEQGYSPEDANFYAQGYKGMTSPNMSFGPEYKAYQQDPFMQNSHQDPYFESVFDQIAQQNIQQQTNKSIQNSKTKEGKMKLMFLLLMMGEFGLAMLLFASTTRKQNRVLQKIQMDQLNRVKQARSRAIAAFSKIERPVSNPGDSPERMARSQKESNRAATAAQSINYLIQDFGSQTQELMSSMQAGQRFVQDIQQLAKTIIDSQDRARNRIAAG